MLGLISKVVRYCPGIFLGLRKRANGKVLLFFFKSTHLRKLIVRQNVQERLLLTMNRKVFLAAKEWSPFTSQLLYLNNGLFILRTHYPSWRTWANILLFVCLCVSSTKTGTRRIMSPDELPFLKRRSRRISKESSPRRIMPLVPVFIPETHNQTNYECLPKFVQTNNSSLI